MCDGRRPLCDRRRVNAEWIPYLETSSKIGYSALRSRRNRKGAESHHYNGDKVCKMHSRPRWSTLASPGSQLKNVLLHIPNLEGCNADDG